MKKLNDMRILENFDVLSFVVSLIKEKNVREVDEDEIDGSEEIEVFVK